MKLSICIPTHDSRVAPLKEAIDGILVQIAHGVPGEVEICVSDNASVDGTAEMMQEYAGRYPGRFVYRRNETNLKFLKNLLQVFSLATGDYCWLLSSDDQIAEGGILAAMQMLQAHPEAAGMTVCASRYDKSMQHEIGPFSPSLLPNECEQAHIYTSAHDAFTHCGAFLSYISVLIVDRALWQEAAAEAGEERLHSFRHFPQTFLIGSVINKRPCWLWNPSPLVKCRTANDALIELMSGNRIQYHIETMHDGAQVWAALLGRRSAVHRTMTRKVHPLTWGAYAMIEAKRAPCSPRDELAALIVFTRNLYFLPGFWKYTFPVLLLPRAVILVAFKLGWAKKLRSALTSLRRLRSLRGHASDV